MKQTLSYLNTLVVQFGRGWNEFWYNPSDPLTLGVMRFACGVVSLVAVATYGLDLDRFFGAEGIFSPSMVNSLMETDAFRFSYLDGLSGNALATAHWGGIAILALYTLGVMTRITSVLALVVVLAYFQRAPMITAHFESLLPAIMFYLCLGPAGRYFSVDAWLRKDQPKFDAATGRPTAAATWTATIPLRLIQIHLAVAVLMMGLGKLQWYVWWEGTAVWWMALNTDSAIVNFTYLANYPFLVNFLTHALLVFELAFPVLVWKDLFRPLMIGIAWNIWPLIAGLTGLVTFVAVMMIASVAFVQVSTIRRLAGLVVRSEKLLGPAEA